MTKMKSKKSQTGTPVRAKRLPRKKEQYAVIREAVGGSRFMVLCEDGKTRLMRVPGKFKRRMWVRIKDIVIISPWVVQTHYKCDLVYRYLPPERNWLIRNKRLPKELIV